jgi:hypothetical protein
MLFTIIGTNWGSGDGSTTFNLPNLNGRASIGSGTVIDGTGASYSYSFAQSLGSVAAPITQSNLPNYNLTTISAGDHSHGGYAYGGNHAHTTDTQGAHVHSFTGSDGVHTHAVRDPQHQHSYNDYYTGGTGGYVGSGTLSAFVQAASTTASAYSGVTVDYNDGWHSHNISTAGAHSHTTSYSGNLTCTIGIDGAHTHTVPLGGGGQAMLVLNPIAVVTKIIYAGVATTALAAMTATVATADTTEIEQLRAEIEELKRILMPQRRVTHAPMRGVH